MYFLKLLTVRITLVLLDCCLYFQIVISILYIIFLIILFYIFMYSNEQSLKYNHSIPFHLFKSKVKVIEYW